MSLQLIKDDDLGYSVLFSPESMRPVGGVFYEGEDANDFIEWLPKYINEYNDDELCQAMSDWRVNKEK